MKKSALILIALLTVCFAASARQISENEAMLKAAAFGQKAVASRLMSTSHSSAMKLAYTQKSAKSAADNCFYVFNRGIADGYVIVSADDRAQSILGYTDSGSFDYASLPANARWWFSEYQRQIQYLIDHPNFKNRVVPKSLPTSVAPLCTSLWNQLSPYNDNCPTYTDTTGSIVHCASGCVATAMSQVMFYHKWPITGTGSNSYTSREIENGDTLVYDLSADFSKSTYDWANMSSLYSSVSTTEQKAAVAKLLSDVGISCYMGYASTSNAEPNTISSALVNNFGYDKSASLLSRNYYNISEWNDLLKGELNAKRPVFYGGSSSYGGHAFVIDGYNTENYYHLNWGWGGLSNGYFTISALDPNSLGTGGGEGGYNYDQACLIHIMKPSPGLSYLYCITFDSIDAVNTSVALGETVPVRIKDICNYEYKPFTGAIGLVTRDDKGTVVDIQGVNGDFTKNMEYGETINHTFNFSYKVPTILSDGVYSMMVEALASGDSVWQPLRGYIGSISHFIVSVSGSMASIVSSPDESSLSALVSSISPNLYNGKASNISVTVFNAGGEYHGNVILSIFDADLNPIQSEAVIADIPAGQSVTLPFITLIMAPAGTAYIQLMDNDSTAIGSKTVQIMPPPADPSLSLTEPLSFPDNDNVDPLCALLSAKIKNIGGLYSNRITAIFFDSNGDSFDQRDCFLILDKNETKTVTYSEGLSNYLPGVRYFARLYAYDDSSNIYSIQPISLNSVSFCVKSSVPSAVSAVGNSANSIFPNPAADVVTVRNAYAISGISVYSVTGALVLSKAVSGQNSATLNVASLPAGSYIVRVANSAGITTQRFIKK